MIFRERTYSVLLVTSSAGMAESLSAQLPPSEYFPVNTVRSAGEARRACLDISYDIIIISAPLSDEFGSRLASDISAGAGSGVLLMVKRENLDEVADRVMEYGVLTLSKPCSSRSFRDALRSLCTMREKIRRMEEKQHSIEDKIEEMRKTDRAKWLLIECLGMTEAQAHRYIEKQAMDMRISKREAAERIIKTYS